MTRLVVAMKRLISFVLFGGFCLLPLCSFGQVSGNSICGRVVCNDRPVDYFCVTLSSPTDSLFLAGGAFENGEFRFSGLELNSYDVEISSLGYVPIRRTVHIDHGTFDFGTLNLMEDARQIDAVAVVAARQLFKQDKGLLTVNVGGTMLENAGSLFDVLQRSPGVIVDRNEQIKVFGKGEPVIYIDNREIVSLEELNALQSTDIDRIEIDRNPSSKYSAAGHAILRIRTKRSRTDNFSVAVYDRITVGRKISNSVGAQFNNNKNRWANLLSYAYEYADKLDYNKSYEFNTLPTCVIENFGDITNLYHHGRHTLFSGNEYRISDRSRIGLQFNGYWQNNDSDRKQIQQIRKSGEADIDKLILLREFGRSSLYNTNVSYQLNPDSTANRLEVVLGYAYTSNATDIDTDEKRLPAFPSLLYEINSRSAFSVYSATADYQFRFLKFLDVGVGAKYSYVHNDGSSRQFDLESGHTLYAQQSRINDKIAAGYLQIKKKIGKFDLSAGLRYEHTASETTVDAALIDTTYNSFFPSFRANYAPGDNLDFSLSYSKRIVRPGFKQVNPNIIYLDSLSYGVGNPLLTPVYINNVELNVSIHDFTLIAGYTHKRNHIIETAENDPANPDITRWSYQNLPRSQSVLLGGIYSKRWGFYALNAEAYIEKPFVSVLYLDEIIKRNKPLWMFSVSNSFTLRKNLSLYCAFEYQSEGDDGITRCGESYNLSAALIWRLLRDRLRLSLSANDLLGTVNGNTWEDRHNNIITGMKSRQDSRYVRFEVRFNFNNTQSGIKNRANNSEELNRM